MMSLFYVECRLPVFQPSPLLARGLAISSISIHLSHLLPSCLHPSPSMVSFCCDFIFAHPYPLTVHSRGSDIWEPSTITSSLFAGNQTSIPYDGRMFHDSRTDLKY